jgi:hypothetical protein
MIATVAATSPSNMTRQNLDNAPYFSGVVFSGVSGMMSLIWYSDSPTPNATNTANQISRSSRTARTTALRGVRP